MCVFRECEAGLGQEVVGKALSSLDLLDSDTDPVSCAAGHNGITNFVALYSEGHETTSASSGPWTT